MVNISIDVTDLGGEAHPGDKVIFWRPRVGGSATHAGRVISTAPHTVLLEDGTATVPDVEPGEMRVLLQCRGFESHAPIPVVVPDGTGVVTLRALVESQFEYAPPIVSAVQQAASNASASEEAAIRAQVRSEAAADRADARVDDAINNGANLVRNEVKQDADRAVAARQAAAQSESNAAASEDAAATSETNAKQAETNAGDYAAVATTAATEAVGAMESASDAVSSIGDSVNAAAGHADRAEQHESGAAAYAQNASDAADRAGTAEQIEGWVQQAQDAADRIGTAEQVEGWATWAQTSASAAAQSETRAEEYRDAALSAANSTSDAVRSELASIAADASTSESNARVSETNAATHAANSLSAAERAELAATETIQQVEGDFATRNYVDQRVPVGLFAGAGSPEGAVAAPVGSIYTDSAATNGAIRWVKTSGTGNAGWSVEYGDTGWRELTHLLSDDWSVSSGGHVRIRRRYNTVMVSFRGLHSTAGAAGNIVELPVGFRPAETETSVEWPADRNQKDRYATASTWWLRIWGITAGAITTPGVTNVLSFPAAAVWPTSLPGTPA